MNNDDWPKHKLLLLENVRRNDHDHEMISTKLDKIYEQLVTLQIKSGVWGGIAGMIGACVPFIVYLFKR